MKFSIYDYNIVLDTSNEVQNNFISLDVFQTSLAYWSSKTCTWVFFLRFANKIAPPSIIYIQRGLTKFLWFFNYFLDWKGINSSGDMTEKEVSIFSVFWRKLFLFYFTWGQWRHLVLDKSIGTFFFQYGSEFWFPSFLLNVAVVFKSNHVTRHFLNLHYDQMSNLFYFIIEDKWCLVYLLHG